MRTWLLAIVSAVLGCSHAPPRMKLERVILYQNGIGYFERSGHVGGDRLVLPFSRHEVDDVLKTLTVISKQGAGVATVDVPAIGPKDRMVEVGVKLSGGGDHDVRVTYAVPTPTWKAAYRIVLDDTREPAPGLLQGWAVIDNVSQEDWTNVRLTLATGAPMSYALDLKTPQYVERPDITGKMVKPAVLGPVDAETAGAAESDPDGDGIPTKDDACPNDPEDKDGFEDDDGCPDPDNDQDRIPDHDDMCPNDPENYNGIDDHDGCPDRGRVIISDAAVSVLDIIYFDAKSAKIRKAALPIVDAVAATLAGNPDLLKIEVQGHAAKNERDPFGIAERRADAVKTALVARGIAASRLVARGYGATQPRAADTNEQAHAKNRRVSFLIVERSPDATPATPARPTPSPAPTVIDTRTAQASARTSTRPVEVAGTVRYELAEPVTIRRNSSTMVSILNKPVTAEDAYLWRPDPNAPGSERHPFRVVRLVNSSGFTLQPGSIAIYARGTFVGDGLLGQLGRDETAWVPYALDSGTTVTVTRDSEERPVRILAIERGTVTVEASAVSRTTYRVAAAREPAARIYLRHDKAIDHAAVELPPGTIDRGDAYLLPLPLSPAKTSELVIEERKPRTHTHALVDSDPKALAVYVQGSQLPADVATKLAAALELRKQHAAIEHEVAELRDRLDDHANRAYELRENLRTLERVKTAADLEKKLLASLAETSQQSDQLSKQIAAKTELAAAARAKLAEAIRELAFAAPTPAKAPNPAHP